MTSTSRMNNGPDAAPIGEYLGSLDAGLKVMTLFSTCDSISITTVTDFLQCSRSTAYRILNTLRHRGIIILGPSGRGYFPGPVLLDLARPRGIDLADRARLRPIIDAAVSFTGETVHVATLVGTQILFFDGGEPDRPIRAALRPGYLRPAHAISAGKLLLSQLTDRQIASLYPSSALPTLTQWTTDNLPDLMKELQEVRRTGEAYTRRGVETGSCGTSVLLPGRSWRERLALCATVPLDRGDDDTLRTVNSGLKQAADLLKLRE